MYQQLFIEKVQAAGDIDLSSFGRFTGSLTSLAYSIAGILLTVALAVFFFRIVIFIYKIGASPKAVEDGKKLLFWGVIALFVVVSLWGIVGIFTGSVFNTTPGIPQLGR